MESRLWWCWGEVSTPYNLTSWFQPQKEQFTAWSSRAQLGRPKWQKKSPSELALTCQQMCEANKPGESVNAVKEVIEQGANVSNPKKMFQKLPKLNRRCQQGVQMLWSQRNGVLKDSGVDLKEAEASNNMVKPTSGQIKKWQNASKPKKWKAQVNPKNGPWKGKELNWQCGQKRWKGKSDQNEATENTRKIGNFLY